MFAALLGTSVAEAIEKKDGQFQVFTAATDLKQWVAQAKASGRQYAIIDYRSRAEYDAGHIPGAVWIMQATPTNVAAPDNKFAHAVLARYPVTTCIILYGNSFTLERDVAGSVSAAGYNVAHTFSYSGGYSQWTEQ